MFDSLTEPVFPGSLATPEQLCAYWSAMDAHYSTPTDSPLHHHNRCEYHALALDHALAQFTYATMYRDTTR